jgi:hypothetical protein
MLDEDRKRSQSIELEVAMKARKINRIKVNRFAEKVSHRLLSRVGVCLALLVGLLVPVPVTAVGFDINMVGRWPGYNRGGASAVAISGDYAYVSVGAGLHVLELVDSADPQLITAVDFDDVAADIAVSGDYAYVVTAAMLRVSDISQPSYPMQVGSCETKVGRPRDLVVSGNYAYLVVLDREMKNAWLQTIDVSNPGQPRTLGSYVVNGPWGYNRTGTLAVSGHFAY